MLALLTLGGFRKVVTLAPFTVGTIAPSLKSEDNTVPSTTWYKRTSVKRSGSEEIASSIAGSRAAKASLEGAKTVKGPSPERTSSSPV